MSCRIHKASPSSLPPPPRDTVERGGRSDPGDRTRMASPDPRSASFAEYEQLQTSGGRRRRAAGARGLRGQHAGPPLCRLRGLPRQRGAAGAGDRHLRRHPRLERIGTLLVLDYMRALLGRLEWDELLRRQLESVRLVFMPIVNPGGMWAGTRANPAGVDLMRNAPQDAEGAVLLAGGQRYGARLPWYRGAGAPMESESAAMLRVVEEELLPRPLSFAVDCHSGYGWRDSIWFPYARTTRPMPHRRDVPAQDLVRAGPPAPRLRLRAAEPAVPAARRPVGLRLRPCAGAQPVPADDARTRLRLWIKKNPRQLFRARVSSTPSWPTAPRACCGATSACSISSAAGGGAAALAAARRATRAPAPGRGRPLARRRR